MGLIPISAKFWANFILIRFNNGGYYESNIFS